jgi:hypothetical protein
MPGSQEEKVPEDPRREDLDDIQTLKNLLELRVFLNKEKNSLTESLD